MRGTHPTTLKIPEWPEMVSKIAQYLYFDCNKERLISSQIDKRPEEIQTSLDRLQFFQEYLVDEYAHAFIDEAKHLEGKTPLLQLAAHNSKAGFLNIRDQNRLVLAWELAWKLAKGSSRHPLNPCTELLAQTQRHECQKIIKDFRHLIATDGEIDPSRHPKLNELYHQLYDQEENLRRQVNELVRSEDWKNILQYDGFDVIDERYVIPVRTDSYRAQLGLIISRSDSGHTLYVEPFIVRDLAHKRLETLSKIREIIYQIEQSFHRRLCEQAHPLKEAVDALLLFDDSLGKARFCLSASLTRPKIRGRAGFAFHDLFHPLIKGPVKNDVYLDNVHTALVISGPNTGGKTALIKAIAISYKLFLQGLFVPALHAELYPYATLFFLANDLQDIGLGLSSFSGEVKTYLDLSLGLESHNLILIDEIFNSTASDEASALTLALIDNFNLRRHTHFVLSTHHQLLKNLASERPTILSGSMGFDVALMRPNYRFYQGVPGQSMAVEIFERLAEDNPYGKLIADEARNLLDKKQVNYEKLVSQVAQKGRELDELLLANRAKERELMNRERSLEGIMKLRMDDELTRARERIEQISRDAINVLEQTKAGELQKPRRVEDKFLQIKRSLDRDLRPSETAQSEEGSESDTLPVHLLRVENYYYNTLLKKDVQLKSIDWRKRQAVVTKGALTVNVPLNTFKKGTTTVNSFQQIRISVARETTDRSFALDCRGMRLEEFQHTVEKGLADLLAGDIPVLSVIHGHGDGVLKAWLRGFIGKHKHFRWDVPQNGNDGETEIRVKD